MSVSINKFFRCYEVVSKKKVYDTAELIENTQYQTHQYYFSCNFYYTYLRKLDNAEIPRKKCFKKKELY